MKFIEKQLEFLVFDLTSFNPLGQVQRLHMPLLMKVQHGALKSSEYNLKRSQIKNITSECLYHSCFFLCFSNEKCSN